MKDFKHAHDQVGQAELCEPQLRPEKVVENGGRFREALRRSPTRDTRRNNNKSS